MRCLLKDNGEWFEQTQEGINLIIDAYNSKRGKRYVTVEEVVLGLGCTIILMDMGRSGWRKKDYRRPEITHRIAVDMKIVPGKDSELPEYQKTHIELEFENIQDLMIKPLSGEE